MNHDPQYRVLELAALLCDELITAKQFAELDELLAADGEAREAYRGFLALHQRLENGALEAQDAVAATSPFTAVPAPENASNLRPPWRPGTADTTGPDPACDGGTLEGRIRKAERRTLWSMAACLVVGVFTIALLFRPKSDSEPQTGRLWTEEDSARKSSTSNRESAEKTPSVPRESLKPESEQRVVEKMVEQVSAGNSSSGTTRREGRIVSRPHGESGKRDDRLADVPPPPPPPGGPSDNADQIEEANGGFLIRKAAINDTFQMLAKRAGKQYFDNTKIAGPEFTVSGHLNGGDPMQQMEELAFAHGLTLYQKGNTVYALNAEQLSQLPTKELHYPLRYLRPSDGDQVKALIQPMLSPTGVVKYDPDTNSLTLTDSAHQLEKAEDLLTSVDQDARRSFDAEPGEYDAPRKRAWEAEPVTMALIDRVPVITSTINETEVSNQVTEEVRYQVDQKDPVGDPATTREIGVSVAVTPTLLSDGTIRLKMRPRSAQIVEEVTGQSGNRYPKVSEGMLEQIARIPEGHSLVLGGFYGQVKPKEDKKVPLLGDIPHVGLFFKDQEAAQEPASLLFVATPTTLNDQVVVETKVLKVNDQAAKKTGLDWASGLDATGMTIESIGSLNSLFGIEGAGEVTSNVLSTGTTAAADHPIVLNPAQTKEVLRALGSSGLVTQIANPTHVTSLVREGEIEGSKRDPREDLEKNAAATPVSTFSLHVSDVSFKLAKAALARGEWPKPTEVRVEEFVNAFDYGDPAPTQHERIACKLEQAAHPFLQKRNLLRVSMKTATLGRAAATPLRLTILLDKSGSMERIDRIESVENAFRLLAGQLTPRDQVTLIGFSRTPRLLADRVTGDKAAELADLVASTPSEGGTNLVEALRLGMEKANEQLLEGGQNRVILLTDGAVNLGNCRPDDLARMVETMRQQQIAFDACGVGADGLNDEILEALTRKGDGRYYFLDRPEDADEGFARQIAGALRPAARNVKVQVIFNPNRVGRYKLYGFEHYRLKKEDFRNDSVDAAELAAEEAGNAIYQFEVLPEGRGEIGTVSVRFQDTESGQMVERTWTIPYEAQVTRLEDSAASLRLASSAALLGEKLTGSQIGDSVEMSRLWKLTNSLVSEFPSCNRVKELVQMTNTARELTGE